MIKVGFNLNIWIRDDYFDNIYRGVDELSLAGFDGVEFAGIRYERFWARPAETRRWLAMHDLELSSHHHGYQYTDRDLFPAELDNLKRMVHFTAEMGCRTVLLDGAPGPWADPRDASPELVSDDHIKAVADAAMQMARYATEEGLTAAWHQHWGTSIFTFPSVFDRFMELTDPSVLKFCPDTAQLGISGYDIVGTFEKYASRIGFVHFKDYEPTHNWAITARHGGPTGPADSGGYRVDSQWSMIELGRGLVDFPACLAILRGVNYDGWIVDDHDFTAYLRLDSARACREYLRNIGLPGRRGAGLPLVEPGPR